MENKIETSRLILRELKSDEIPKIKDLIRLEKINSQLEGGDIVFRDRIDHLVFSLSYSYGNDKDFPYGIFMKDNKTLIGYINAMPRYENLTAEIGFFLDPNYWNQGFTTEALHALAKEIFKSWGLVKIHTSIFANNSPSRRVLEKVGFQKEGTLRKHSRKNHESRDVELWAILREDFLDETKVDTPDISGLLQTC